MQNHGFVPMNFFCHVENWPFIPVLCCTSWYQIVFFLCFLCCKIACHVTQNQSCLNRIFCEYLLQDPPPPSFTGLFWSDPDFCKCRFKWGKLAGFLTRLRKYELGCGLCYWICWCNLLESLNLSAPRFSIYKNLRYLIYSSSPLLVSQLFRLKGLWGRYSFMVYVCTASSTTRPFCATVLKKITIFCMVYIQFILWVTIDPFSLCL